MNDFMGGSSFAIASGTGDNLLLLCSGQVSHDFRGHSQGKYAGWDVFMFRDESASSDHGIGANVGVRQHYGIHAYEDMVSKGRAVDDGSMPNGTFITNSEGRVLVDVQGAIILDIGTTPDHDGGRVSAHDGIVPDACAFMDSDVSNDDCAWGNEDIFGNGWCDAFVW